MSRKNEFKTTLDRLEFTFDEFFLQLREADKLGKFSKKHQIAAATMIQLVKSTAGDIDPSPKKPMKW